MTHPNITPTDETKQALVAALKWYAEKASALARVDIGERPHVAEAIFTELRLDAGRRAALALAAKDDGVTIRLTPEMVAAGEEAFDDCYNLKHFDRTNDAVRIIFRAMGAAGGIKVEG